MTSYYCKHLLPCTHPSPTLESPSVLYATRCVNSINLARPPARQAPIALPDSPHHQPRTRIAKNTRHGKIQKGERERRHGAQHSPSFLCSPRCPRGSTRSDTGCTCVCTATCTARTATRSVSFSMRIILGSCERVRDLLLRNRTEETATGKGYLSWNGTDGETHRVPATPAIPMQPRSLDRRSPRQCVARLKAHDGARRRLDLRRIRRVVSASAHQERHLL